MNRLVDLGGAAGQFEPGKDAPSAVLGFKIFAAAIQKSGILLSILYIHKCIDKDVVWMPAVVWFL